MKINSDKSTHKKITVRTHSSGTCYAAAIGSFDNKEHGLRIEITEPKTNKKFYFVVPYAAYQHMSDTTTLEIPFNLDGLPFKQRTNLGKTGVPNWWIYEVKTWTDMCLATIDNTSKSPVTSQVNNLFTFEE